MKEQLKEKEEAGAVELRSTTPILISLAFLLR